MNSAENMISNLNCGRYDNITLANERDCTGCGACMSSCGVHAIEMREDPGKHFLYPVIDKEKCCGCWTCRSICTVIHYTEGRRKVFKVYAANNQSICVREKSASGGLFGAFAMYVLSQGGAVVGVKYVGNTRCEHLLITEPEQIDDLFGTKYFQSDIRKAFIQMKEFSKKSSEMIMFCGTPCQVEAAKRYAGMNGFYERLFTLELLCRGVPPYFLQAKYIEHLEKKNHGRITSYRMKEKSNGWHNIGIIAELEDGRVIYEKGLESAFGKAFMASNYAIRDSCFECKFKSYMRHGDIVIGDFWGYRNSHLIDDKGTSAVMILSELGRKMFDEVSKNLDYTRSTEWRVYKGNKPAFETVTCDGEKRELFWKLLNTEMDLEEIVSLIE